MIAFQIADTRMLAPGCEGNQALQYANPRDLRVFLKRCRWASGRASNLVTFSRSRLPLLERETPTLPERRKLSSGLFDILQSSNPAARREFAQAFTGRLGVGTIMYIGRSMYGAENLRRKWLTWPRSTRCPLQVCNPSVDNLLNLYGPDSISGKHLKIASL